jgi:predicted NACHT family NTPase
MRRTAEDITLTYRLSTDGQEISLDDLIDVLSNQAGRVILTGPPGVGKTYTTLQVAAALIRRDSSTIPLVVPLSRWTEIIAITDGLSRFLETEFNVPAPAAKELVETGKILPIFDGLDEPQV